MEGDELEMSREELRAWIRRRIKRAGLMPPDVREKCSLLRSLLARKEKQAARLLKLRQSVAACEALVRKQYASLGWEYRDTDSSDDEGDPEVTGHGRTPSPSTSGTGPLLPSRRDGTEATIRDIKMSCLRRRPLVVLTRLPEGETGGLRPARPRKHSGGGFSSGSDSDAQSPEDDLSDSDYSTSLPPSKRRRIDPGSVEPARCGAAGKTRPQTRAKTDAKWSGTEASPSQPSENGTRRRRATKTAGTDKSAEGASEIRPGGHQTEITLHMNVLAKWRALNWKRGEIVQIVTKDGKCKYKVNFAEKGKALVSAHHVASDTAAKAEHLHVGARVVVACEGQPSFRPGVVAELPGKENRFRFLVFIDDQTSLYVGLPSLHLVCKPLMDPFDDISNNTHRDFIREYLRVWPYNSYSACKVGQMLRAELYGVQQWCQVLEVDCSLMQLLYQKSQRKEWLYQGSFRLGHIASLRKQLESTQET